MSTDRRAGALLLTLFVALAACSDGDLSTTTQTSDSESTSVTAPATTAATTTTVTLPQPDRVDDVLARCPSLFDVDFVLSGIDLVLDADPTGPILVCEESDGSADLTRLEERAVQALLVMELTSFEEPLPWTDLGLFEWFTTTIDGIRFRDDIDLSFCCDPEGYINIQTADLAAIGTDRWIDPSTGAGLIDLVALFVHEARHAEGPVHTCDGGNDATAAELGAWAVQAALYRWYADLVDQTFFDDPDRPGYYAATAGFNADRILETRICGEGG